MMNSKTRRSFIKSVGSGIFGGAALTNGLLPLFANASAPAGDNYRALVCINLDGGNDAFNTVVPTNSSAYQSYSQARRNIALPRETLIGINALSAQNDTYGFNPVLADVAHLYHLGNLAIVGNVGNLIEPVTKAGYFDKTVSLPPHLFSHNDQKEFLYALNSSQKANVSTGWAGRIAEAMAGFNINQQLAMNITLSGDNLFQRGSSILPYSVKNTGVNVIDPLSTTDPASYVASRAALYRHFLNRQRDHQLQAYYADIQLNAWTMAQYVADILAAQPKHNLPYLTGTTTSGLMQGLSMITNLMVAREAFQVKRQIFYVNLGSFDTHRNQLVNQTELLQELDICMYEFYQLLSELGLANNVTTFTASEFGRTLTMNGNDGTDHGWTNHHLVMGGAVAGGQIVGQMPSLVLGGEHDLGEGRIIPNLSFDQYAATLSKWFGVSNEDTHAIFPNLGNFDQQDLGFFG